MAEFEPLIQINEDLYKQIRDPYILRWIDSVAPAYNTSDITSSPLPSQDENVSEQKGTFTGIQRYFQGPLGAAATTRGSSAPSEGSASVGVFSASLSIAETRSSGPDDEGLRYASNHQDKDF